LLLPSIGCRLILKTLLPLSRLRKVWLCLLFSGGLIGAFQTMRAYWLLTPISALFGIGPGLFTPYNG